MKISDVYLMAIWPACDLLNRLAPEKRWASPEATVELLAIGMQETGFLTRVQYGNGPARSFWQFEEGGGVKGVMNHHVVGKYCKAVTDYFGIPFDKKAIWKAMETNDVLGAAMARLLLYSSPKPLPKLGEVDKAWAMYEDNWRPGKPHPDKWPANYAAALKEVKG